MKELISLQEAGAVEWQTQEGQILRLDEMVTSHLFFSLRMIWNHSVPTEHRIEPFKRYTIPERTMERFLEIVPAMILHLSTRDDLTPYFLRCLSKMAGIQSLPLPNLTLGNSVCDDFEIEPV